MTPTDAALAGLRVLIAELVDEALAKRAPANDATGTSHLTVAEYAKRYAISQSTVRAAIRERRLEHMRIGRAVRIPQEAQIQRSDPDSATDRARLKLLGSGKR